MGPKSERARMAAELRFAELLRRIEAGEELDAEAWVEAQEARLRPHLRGLCTAHRRAERGLETSLTPPPCVPSAMPALPLQTESAAEVGEGIDDFRLVRRIACGGMGEVWEAWQRSLDRRVALKLLRPDRIDERSLELFGREARAAGRLSHPGIVGVYGSGRSEGRAWIAMELVEGPRGTLADRLDALKRRNSLPVDHDRAVARLVARLADALEIAHGAGVIHRDLKPSNVLLRADGEPVVTDFGLACLTDESALSTTGEIGGTWYYMAPEQVAARRAELDQRADVFSLGVVLYELLTLQRPFQGDTLHQVASQILDKDPPDPRTIRSRVPEELAVIVGKALEKEPAQRFQGMRELADDLRRFLAEEPIRAQPPTRPQRTLRWLRRHPALGSAAAVALVGFAIVLGLFAVVAAARRDLAAEVRSVKQLAAIQDLEDLVARADGLWPARPERAPDYRAWIAAAERLAAELPHHRAQRDELRRLAIARAGDAAGEQARHGEDARLERVEAELDALRRATGRRAGGAPFTPPALEGELAALSPDEQRELAWTLVSPEREVLGREPEGLALALAALAGAPRDHAARTHEIAAWGWFALGEDDMAFAAGEAALALAGTPERARIEASVDQLIEALDRVNSGAGLDADERRLAELELERRFLRAVAVDDRPGAQADEALELRWWDGQLTKLIAGLELLTDEETGLLSPAGVSPVHGWSVPRRLAVAEGLDLRVERATTRERWDAARVAIAEHPAYGGLELASQPDLVPLGPDPRSGLWEFAHLASGVEPQRDADGELMLEGCSGVVLVLVPGGTAWIGAQAIDMNERHHDPLADEAEGPVHEVTLSPYLLAKHELTQGQWQHLTGRNPSSHQASPLAPTLRHPVEQVSWEECALWLGRAGLELPTEAQWERACRAGTDTPWWTGASPASLAAARAANLADQSTVRARAGFGAFGAAPEPDDGSVVHAEVERFAPNPFGLHGMHGNVSEWCRDAFVASFYARGPRRDPLATHPGDPLRVQRGGDYAVTARDARASSRFVNVPSKRDEALGVRPARALVR